MSIRKLTFLTTFLLINISFLFSQSYFPDNSPLLKLSEKQNPTFNEIKEAYQKHWDVQAIDKPAGWKQYKRWEHFWETRTMPDGTFPNGSVILRNYLKDSKNQRTKNDGMQSQEWSLLGPINTPEEITNSRQQGLGRVNVVRFDPKNVNVIWAGSATGGVWKSTDGGSSWKTFPFTNFLSLGISDIAISPKDPNVVYVSTGDDDGTYGTAGAYYSVGLIKTYYGGETWDTTSLSSVLEDRFVTSRVLVHPDDYNIVYVATSKGIYISKDGGNTWDKKLQGVSIKDMEFMPNNPEIINATSLSYSGKVDFYHSTDSGNSWSKVHTLTDCIRANITVSPSNPHKVWAISARRNYSSFHSFLISEDDGATWDTYLDYTIAPNILGRFKGVNNDALVGQGSYDLCLAVNPNSEDNIYVGGINVWKSNNGGTSFEILTHYSGWYNKFLLHADIHDLEFQPKTNLLYSANDGGLYRSSDYGATWEELTNGMSITQLYRIGLSSTDENKLIVGCQDNGTSMKNANGWFHVQAGDGMEAAINPDDSKMMYATYYYGSLHRSTNGGTSFKKCIDADEVQESGAWVTPFIIDSAQSNVMYIGFQNVWKSTNYGISKSWKKVSNFNGHNLQSMAIAPSDHNVVYAATYGIIYVSYDAGVSWQNIYSASRPITYISVDPNNPKRIWLSFGGYYSDSKVIEINDGEVKNLTGNLANVPVNCIIYQKDSPDRLYIGTDLGVFYSDYESAYWERYGDGLPNVIVNELEIHYASRKLVAATYGRGVWETGLIDCNIKQPKVIQYGDNEICQGDTVILEAEEGFSNYEWSNGEKTRIIKVTESGYYTVRVFDNTGCHANSETIHIIVKTVPDIKINTSNKGICPQDSIRLTASLGFSNYLWSNNKTGRSIYVSQPGFYWVEGTYNNGCVRKSEELTVSELSAPKKPLIEQEGNVLTAVIDNAEIKSYQWYLNGKKIKNATKKTYTILESGKYIVEVTDTNSCNSISDEFNFVVGVKEISTALGTISIYPNPSQGVYHLSISNNKAKNVDITISNLLGTDIYHINKVLNNMNYQTVINIQSQPEGIYLVRIMMNNISKSIKIIKK